MNNRTNKRSIVIGVVIILVLVVVTAIVFWGGHATTPTAGTNTPAPTPAAIPTATASYTSAKEDGFAVNFPATPQVTTTMFNSLTAGSFPLTEYKTASASGSKGAYYAVFVYHYPASYHFPDNYLAGALQVFGMAVNSRFPGTTIAQQTPTQFLGNPALSAVITVPIPAGLGKGTTPTSDYLLITTKGQNTYIVSTYGLSQDDYDAFIGSFSFTR